MMNHRRLHRNSLHQFQKHLHIIRLRQRLRYCHPYQLHLLQMTLYYYKKYQHMLLRLFVYLHFQLYYYILHLLLQIHLFHQQNLLRHQHHFRHHLQQQLIHCLYLMKVLKEVQILLQFVLLLLHHINQLKQCLHHYIHLLYHYQHRQHLYIKLDSQLNKLYLLNNHQLHQNYLLVLPTLQVDKCLKQEQ